MLYKTLKAHENIVGGCQGRGAHNNHSLSFRYLILYFDDVYTCDHVIPLEYFLNSFFIFSCLWHYHTDILNQILSTVLIKDSAFSFFK